MANVIKIKRSAVPDKAPLTSELALGELAINTYDGKLYLKRDVGGGSGETITAAVTTASLQPRAVTVSSGTTNLDLTLAFNWHLALQANTAFTLTNVDQKIGSSGTIALKQDGTGGHTFTLASQMKTPIGGASIAQVTGANTLSILTYYVYDANTVLVNYIGNFA